jgi:hypothetical protein
MANYLYNGVELPDINTVWTDKETYPYACLCPTLGKEEYSTVLVVVTKRFKSENKYLYFQNSCYYMMYQYDGSGDWYKSLNKTQVASAHKTDIKPFWASANVYDTSGTLYLSASDPVPVREYPIASEVTLSPQSVEVTAGQAQDIQFTLTGTDGTDYTGIATWAYAITDKNGTVSKDDAPWVSWVSAEDGSVLLRITADAPGGHEITVIAAWGTEDDPQDLWAIVTIPVKRVSEQWLYSFKMGLALGLAWKPLPINKEPVAYLYNGVRSPKLPEWDREQYPYATIVTTSTFNWGWDVWLIASQNPFCVRDINSRPCLVHSANENCIEYMIDKGDSDWGEANHTEPKVDSGWPYSGLDSIWTDYDVLYANGSLYLAASEPVPVYE